MEQNKLETQFKEKLNSREIKPTEMAWDRLNAMLSVAEPSESERVYQKPKSKFTWLYIAASFIGFLLISTVIFNQKETSVQNKKTKIVIQQSIKTKSHEKPSNFLIPNSKKNEEETVVVVKKDTLKTNKSLLLKNDSFPNKNNQNQVAELSIINQKTEQESISSQTNATSVDELLARVDKSARLNNKTQNLEVHVNANQLLLQVDSDLEPAFRQSVFSKIADNIKVVKEAVVNRNKE